MADSRGIFRKKERATFSLIFLGGIFAAIIVVLWPFGSIKGLADDRQEASLELSVDDQEHLSNSQAQVLIRVIIRDQADYLNEESCNQVLHGTYNGEGSHGIFLKSRDYDVSAGLACVALTYVLRDAGDYSICPYYVSKDGRQAVRVGPDIRENLYFHIEPKEIETSTVIVDLNRAGAESEGYNKDKYNDNEDSANAFELPNIGMDNRAENSEIDYLADGIEGQSQIETGLEDVSDGAKEYQYDDKIENVSEKSMSAGSEGDLYLSEKINSSDSPKELKNRASVETENGNEMDSEGIRSIYLLLIGICSTIFFACLGVIVTEKLSGKEK